MHGSTSGGRLQRSLLKDRLRHLGARYPQTKYAYYLLRFLLLEGLDYADNCARNFVKSLVRRKPYLSDQHIFFRQYFRHLLGIQPIRGLTYIAPSPQDCGAGCHALSTMRAIAFARACGLTYVHTPFTAIDHADRPMPLWVDAWEAQFNFGMGEALASEHNRSDVVNFASIERIVAPLFGSFNGHHDSVRRIEATISEFRRKYYWNKSHLQNEVLTICVHIRRGDITCDSRVFTRTSIFKKIVSEITAVLDTRGIGYKVRIFTQGNLSDFEIAGVEIFSDVDAIWSMQQMIAADVLVMSNSKFSYVAAIISDGVKIGGGLYAMSDWISVDSNGEFDRIALEAKLARYIEIKASKQRSAIDRQPIPE